MKIKWKSRCKLIGIVFRYSNCSKNENYYMIMINIINVLLHVKYFFLFLLFPTLNILICLVTPNHHIKWNTTHKHTRHLPSSFLLYLLLLFKFNFRKHLQLHFAGKIVSNHRFLTIKFIITMKLKRVDVISEWSWDEPVSPGEVCWN